MIAFFIVLPLVVAFARGEPMITSVAGFALIFGLLIISNAKIVAIFFAIVIPSCMAGVAIGLRYLNSDRSGGT